MQKRLIYDLPTRLFHFLFGLFFIAAFFIAKIFEDDSPWFALHSIFGLLLGTLLLVRLLWGVLGTKYARFSSFVLRPSMLFGYFTGILAGSKRTWAGHNPASSWSALLMWIFTVGLVLTGTQMASGNKINALKEVHELFANGFFLVTAAHIGGLLLHTFRHRDSIAISMVSGKKLGITEHEAISDSKPGLAILLLVFTTLVGGYLWMNFDSKSGTLQFLGIQFQLSEMEETESESHDAEEQESRDSGHRKKSYDDEDL